MRQLNFDTTFTLKLPYKPGQLARLTQIVADEKGLIGDITIVELGDDYTVRTIVVETESEEHTRRIKAKFESLDEIKLLSTTDSVFDCHQGGKIHSGSRIPLNNVSDLRKVYTPGVSSVSLAIQKDPVLAYRYTSFGNSVGIFTNGTRVLGLGDIGPLAALPVMEGKAVLYDQLVGISATPILIQTKDPAEFVKTVLNLAPSFGAIHLEDIRSPDCFQIEDELIQKLKQPVMHDDQHGTAVAALGAVLVACERSSKNLKDAVVGQIGLGAAGSAIARLMLAHGVKKMCVSDTNESSVAWMRQFGATASSFTDIMQSCDIVIAATGKPGLIKSEMVRKGQILFSLSNPNPEIESHTAIQAGAAFALDGRFINNALAFPGLFRAALDTRSSKITNAMKLAAAKAIAQCTPADKLVPDPLERAVHQEVARAVKAVVEKENLVNSASPIFS